ncbi:DMT family transporter [Roseovarius sp. C7]|uniref:DMT family transporter n=1 Tax=Roseovarius sp. C7 TaxID=3398643 RepID=UPI0039F609B4
MDNLRGALLMVLAMTGFAFEDAFIKYMATDLHIGHILMLLGLGGTVVFALATRAQGQPMVTRAVFSKPILLRNLGELLAAVSFVTALSMADLSLVSAILQANPLAVTLAAALFMGETVGWRRYSAIAVGFIGVLMIIRPGFEGFNFASLWALAAVFALALRDLATRRAPPSVTSMQISSYAFATIALSGLGLLIVGGHPLLPAAFPLWPLLGALVAGCTGYYAVVAANRVGDVSFISPFRYSRLLVALAIGVTVFGERPDFWTLLGSAIIIASGLYTILREQRLARRARRAAAKPI